MANLHIGAWWENQDGAGTEQELAAVTDPSNILQVVNTDFFRVPAKYAYIAGVLANITTTVTPRLRFQSPSLDELYGRDQAFVPYVNGGTTDVEPGSPQAFNDYRQYPIPLRAGEDLRVMQVNNPAVASDQSVIAIFSDGPVAPVDPRGAFWARFTGAASAQTAGAWATRALTAATALRTGYYEVLGGIAIGDTLVGAGLTHEYGPNVVPIQAKDAASDIPHRSFEMPGQWGSLCKFHTNSPPGVRLLSNDADNQANEVWLCVRPTSG